MEGLISLLVSLDLSGAFHTIDRNILPQWMEHRIGIKWSLLTLSDRCYFVNDESSRYDKGSYGLPQGFVLGPLVFTLDMLL